MSELFVGLISGTSVDGVDAVLAAFDDDSSQIVAAGTTPFPPDLLSRLRRIIETPQTTLRELGTLDHAVGRFFASCTTNLLQSAGVDAGRVTAVGHHGQTIFHEPDGAERFTMQIGDPNIVAADTGILTVADFRRLDMAFGGQGAPLVPAFHAWRFGATADPRVVVNIGGIANITLIEPSRPVLGFDTGPGNTLLDLWIRRTQSRAFDEAGRFAASGLVDEALLARMLTEPYFAAPAPKSTGRELFHMEWINRYIPATDCAAADVQATLAELTAATIVDSIKSAQPSCSRIIVCGGGAHNDDLLVRLRRRSGVTVETTAEHGLSPDWVEATAFAWLARARLHRRAGNVPSVTGARRDAVLGGVYWPAAP